MYLNTKSMSATGLSILLHYLHNISKLDLFLSNLILLLFQPGLIVANVEVDNVTYNLIKPNPIKTFPMHTL